MIPTQVDCIIVGTGLTNSILAAACSRVGRTVLHVDKNNYYGDDWASFTLQQLIDWLKDNSNNDETTLEQVPEELISKSRMFCIDLCPRLLYSNGPMVELLVKSNVSRYHEFKNNVRILSLVDDELHVMPCRRSDVFTSPLLTNLIDKRRLMKFIELCIKYDPSSEDSLDCQISKNSDKPINVFLEENGLNPALREYIINSIAMVGQTEKTSKACEKIKYFMIATERFGRSPFIFPLYGCGEFPQSFCRLSAVFGGVYCLNTHVNNVEINSKHLEGDSKTAENKPQNFVVKLSNSENEVNSDKLILDMSSAIKLKLADPLKVNQKLSRAILFIRGSIVQNDENLISFLRIPPSGTNPELVHLLEFNSSVTVCPPEMSIVYLWSLSNSSCPRADLNSIVKRFFKEDQILWQVYFQQALGDQDNCSLETPGEAKGLYITKPPRSDVDYEHSIEEAKSIFLRMYPDQEFLPRAPDPDEIINE